MDIFAVIVVVLLTALIGTVYYLVSRKPDFEKMNIVQRFYCREVFKTWDIFLNKLDEDERTIVPYDMMMRHLSSGENTLAKNVFSVDPAELGFKGPKYPMGWPDDLKKIESVTLKGENGEIETGVQYFPAEGYEDFKKMNDAMNGDIGKVVFINSGYRSPGRQAYLVFRQLVNDDSYSLKRTANSLAMPGYSEHGASEGTACDLINQNGISGIEEGQKAEDFEELEEYKWLRENASKYNFHLSYPRDNEYGVTFEPWHWRWEKKKD